MPSSTPKVDESARWPRCADCPYHHRPGSPHPRPGIWIIATTCIACHQRLRAGRGYCQRHDTLRAFKGRIVDGRKIT